MINVTASYSGGEFDFAMQGHANYGNPDIVCAAASGIYFSLSGMIENMECNVSDVQKFEEKGNVRLIFKGDNKAKTCVEMAVIGLMQLAQKYPKCVTVSQCNIM